MEAILNTDIIQEVVPVEHRKNAFEPLTAVELGKTLDSTIKRDETNKIITFLCALSAFTDSSQINISNNAPSSTGKSYIPIEIARYFPAEDVVEIGYASPTSFFHDNSVQEDNRSVVDLERKILILLDQPHPQLLQHLRPLLSHDKKEISLKITDKTKHIGMRTKNIVIKGHSAFMFCSAGLRIDEQESTRFILLSPEISEEKIRASIYEKIKKECDSESYSSALASNPDRAKLKERIKAIKAEHISDIKVVHPQVIQQYYDSKHPAKPRYTRDVGRIISLTKCFALLNLWHRHREGNYILASKDDAIEALKIWESIAKPQELNLPPYLFNLFTDVIEPILRPEGITTQEILREHFRKYERPLADWQLRREILPMLETAGVIILEPDPDDKRRKLIHSAKEI